MKRVLFLTILAAFVLALPASHQVWGKGHVPSHKIQVCHEGETITVGAKALRAHIDHGDCQLPACDFNNVFQIGGPCPSADVDGDDKCDLPNPRADAGGATPACAVGTF